MITHRVEPPPPLTRVFLSTLRIAHRLCKQSSNVDGWLRFFSLQWGDQKSSIEFPRN